jgi:hypothetical protein
MAEITIYGASDDLVEVEGYIRDEFEAYKPWKGTLIAPNGDRLIIRAEFSKAGAEADWTLSIENTGTYPSWPIKFGERPDREGDPAIIIDVPEGTIFKKGIK